MTIQDLAFITQVYELIQTGNTNCNIINKAHKLIYPKENLRSKKQKIKAIVNWWNTTADYTIANYLINKQKTRENDGTTEK